MDDDRRQLYVPRNRNPVEDIGILADALAASDAELFDRDGNLVLLDDGHWVQVNPTLLSSLVTRHVVAKRLVQRPGDRWQVEYGPCEVDEVALRTLITAKTVADGSLAQRLPKAPGEPQRLSPQARDEVRQRLAMGEDKHRIANYYKVDVAAVEMIRRQQGR